MIDTVAQPSAAVLHPDPYLYVSESAAISWNKLLIIALAYSSRNLRAMSHAVTALTVLAPSTDASTTPGLRLGTRGYQGMRQRRAMISSV